jgi:hypothetical protein
LESEDLVEELKALDDFWLNYRGPNNDRSPRPLTQNGLAELLREWDIRTHSIWPRPRLAGSKSKRGYYKSQFVNLWRRYALRGDTTTQAGKIIQLPRPRSDTGSDTAADTGGSDADIDTGS